VKRAETLRRLPETGDDAVADQGDIGRPSGIMREYPLLGEDAVEQRCPPCHHHQRCAEIPFLEVVPDVCNHVGKIHRMAHEPVGTSCRQTAQGRTDPEPSSQAEEAGEAQTRRERHQDEPTRRPREVTWHPPKIQHLGVRVSIRYDDGSVGWQRMILHLRRAPRKGDPENQDVLRDVDPIYNSEGGCQEKEKGQLRRRDAEQEEIGESSPGDSGDVRPHFGRP